MTFVEPLELETWFVNIVSGSFPIFTAISLIALATMAGFFKMTLLTTFFLIGVFLIIFSPWVDASIYVLLIMIAGSLVYFQIVKMIKN